MSTAIPIKTAEHSKDPFSAAPSSSKKIIFVTDVSREIKALGGAIWLLLKPDYGFLIRAEFGKKQFRVVLRPVNGDPAESIPPESNPVHVVRDLPSLRIWLQSLSA